MIRIEDIEKETLANFDNWYNNACISEIASLTQYRKNKDVQGWFHSHKDIVVDEFKSLNQSVSHSIGQIEQAIASDYEKHGANIKADVVKKITSTFADIYPIKEMNSILTKL